MPSPLKNVGASLTAVMLTSAVSVWLLKAVLPPVAVMTVYWPSLPLVWSQARKVIASLTEPVRSPNGISRNCAVGPSSNANSLVVLLIRFASIVSQLVPPLRLYCQLPRLVLSPVIAIASTAEPSLSVMLPSTTRSATVTPLGLVAPSRTRPMLGLGAVLSAGALLTAMPVIDFVPVTAAATPSLTLVAMVKLLLKFAAGVNVNAASNVLTSAMAPLADQTPVPAL